MTHDDELRSRMARLAAGHELGELSVDDVVARGRRRVMRHRARVIAAVLVLVVAVAGVIRLGADDGTTSADVASGVDGADEPEVTTTTAAASTTTVVADDAVPAPSAGTGSDAVSYAGGDRVLPWGDGFVSFGQVFEPSDATMNDLVPDLADRLPAAVVEALGDITDIDEAVTRLEEVGLLDEATDAVLADPELSAAYTQVTAGGTYRAEASVSTDGVTWTALDGFALPGGSEYLNLAQSDGTHLVVVEQQWLEDGTSGSIVVSTTDDLSEWRSVTVPIEPADVPSYVRADAYPDSLALGADGWYLSVSSSTWIDVWSLVPEEIRSQFDGEQGWWPEADGLRIESYDDETGDQTPSVSQVVPWTDLGITYADYQRYSEGGPAAATAFTGSWEGTIAPAIPPTDEGCCVVIGTDAGFVAQSWGVGEFSRSSAPGEPAFHFSADGNAWVEVEGPPGVEYLNGLVAVDGGLIATDGNGGVWRAAADATGWTAVDIAGIPENAGLWFDPQAGRGAATVVDTATYDSRYEAVPYVVVIEQDGYEIRSDTASDGSARVVVTESATGTVVLDELMDPSVSAMPDFVRFEGGTGDIELLGPDGEVIVAIPMRTYNDATSAAIAAAQAETGWVEPEYDYTPDFWLVATFDGITWLVEDLDGAVEEDGFGAAAVNGDTVVVRHWGGGWETFTID